MVGAGNGQQRALGKAHVLEDVRGQEPPVQLIEFRVGDVWETPRGFIYRVTWVGFKEGKKRKQAELRLGSEGPGGRKIRRDWDDVGNWGRLSCGESKEGA